MPTPVSTQPPIVVCKGLCKAFGAQELFENIDLNIHETDRLAIIGPNGSGKSTLLKMIAGIESIDAGSISIRKGARLCYVEQTHRFDPDMTVEQVIWTSLDSVMPETHENHGEREALVSATLSRVGFTDRTQKAGTLSGGWQKRLAIAREIVRGPDLLLLDEPTNHLDIDGLTWLEDMLGAARFGVVVVSHDRRFLDGFAKRIVELSRRYPEGSFMSIGNYQAFLDAQADWFESEAKSRLSLETRVKRETEWLMRGPKARATKARYRVDEAHRLIDELNTARERGRVAETDFEFTGTGSKTKRLMVVRNLAKSLGGKPLFSGLDLIVSPGMRIGLVGPNGSGKTTFLRLLAGELEPDDGSVRTAPSLNVVYFDQKREKLDPAQTLRRTLAPDGDSVFYRDEPIHVQSWASRFRFRRDQLDSPIGSLSGGEQARALIACLILRKCDLLLLDEPTNDLDIPTLEVLEESIVTFPGAVMLVTHDRYMLDRVTTVTLGLDGLGGVSAYADFEQWYAVMQEAAKPARDKAPARERPKQKKKLTYLEDKELKGMEDAISAAEAALEKARARLGDASIATNPGELQKACQAEGLAAAEVERLYSRWSELEEKQNSD
ncbi:MAG TPA: ABC-F family ATP-binding cassette domain-containing protein [Myxococcota bacterium]|nr:ABC-F family ATP-binding cassette domain-containing protein [Myxococcota bacterium]